jgi:hypothetical protein
LIESNVEDNEVEEELERFRIRRLKDAGREEQDANAALVRFTEADTMINSLGQSNDKFLGPILRSRITTPAL